ncbi:MAG: hypothetical protein PHN88_00860 [Ignavibacteria bacterium]|nr:hypothetical protein [Ignavibacteria bacterium]
MEKPTFNSTFRLINDKIIDKLDYSDGEIFYSLIVKYLCGETYYKKWNDISDTEKNYIMNFINKINTNYLNRAQFNELLLLIEQDRMEEDFFKFLWEEKITKENFLNGIKKFRLVSLLCYGNFRFAYKSMSLGKKEDIYKKLGPHWKEIDKNYFSQRPEKAIDIINIEREETQYIGQITGQDIEKEGEFIIRNWNNLEKKWGFDELQELKDIYKQEGEKVKKVQKDAINNTNIYLTWDYIDIYIATSMRNSWEYEDTYDLIQNVLKDKKLEELNLRYFDPTHSLCPGRINKGIVEGLMLKRARCTIYMVQENDTMGKDSELAATLAQGKPVIAFIPEIDINKQKDKIKKLPIKYIRNRLLSLMQEILYDPSNTDKFKEIDIKFNDIIENFLKIVKSDSTEPILSLWKKQDSKIKKQIVGFDKLCQIISLAEQINYDKKAKTLSKYHPLSLQINLESGVANGLLLVRSYKNCVDLLFNLLTNNLRFTIKEKPVEDAEKIENMRNEEKTNTILEEEISKSPFRVISNYEKLSNSFWNFYLNSSVQYFKL